MLGLDIGKDANVHAQEPAVTERLVGRRLQQPLVRHHGTHVHVDPDEPGAGGGGHGERGERVALQHVHADRQRHGPAHFVDRHRHGGHGRGIDPARRERHVAVVFHEQGVDAALGQGPRIVERGLNDAIHVAVPARASGERVEVHHTDHGAIDFQDGAEAHERGEATRGAESANEIARMRAEGMAG